MSYTYLLGPAEESSAECFSDIPVSVLSKSNRMLAKSCSPDSETECCQSSRYGMTCEPSTGGRGEESCEPSAVASHAKTSVRPERSMETKDSTENEADCGPKCEGSCARYHRNTSSWKTRQCSLFGGLVEFSETWPKWGMMQDGEFWALSTPERLTKENGYGFWPTPVKTDGFAVGWCLTSIERKERGETRPSGAHIGSGLKYFRKTGQYLSNGYPNPLLTEWLMGWPASWTDLRPLEMDKFRQWQRWHGESSTLN